MACRSASRFASRSSRSLSPAQQTLGLLDDDERFVLEQYPHSRWQQTFGAHLVLGTNRDHIPRMQRVVGAFYRLSVDLNRPVLEPLAQLCPLHVRVTGKEKGHELLRVFDRVWCGHDAWLRCREPLPMGWDRARCAPRESRQERARERGSACRRCYDNGGEWATRGGSGAHEATTNLTDKFVSPAGVRDERDRVRLLAAEYRACS